MRTLGIDLGTNSIGWALLETNGEPGEDTSSGRILAAGVRIYSQSEFAGRNPKSMASMAVARREARGMRRRRDRYLRRRAALLTQLIQLGLMPKDEDSQRELLLATSDGPQADLTKNVYALRARAATTHVSTHELGRILFLLNQRRGFKSNRKTPTNEEGKISIGASRLEQEMMAAGAKTYGIWLNHRRLAGLSVRSRLRAETGEGAKGTGYDFYPTRYLLEKEFDIITAEQRKHLPQILNDKTIAALRQTIFFQRPLKDPIVGKCCYNDGEERLPKAHPLYQQFRLYKEVNELKLKTEQQQEMRLTPDQRDLLLLELRAKREVSFTTLRKRLKLGTEWRFNKESENRTKLLGDEVAAALSKVDAFGPQWSTLSPESQVEFIDKMMDTEDAETLTAWIAERHSHLTEEQQENICAIHLPAGYSRIGESAARNLLDAMKNEVDADGRVITEAEAAQRVYGKTNSERDLNEKGHDLLPHYQEILRRNIPPGVGGSEDAEPDYDKRMGRITNPTVHIGLNQLRRVVNEVIKHHGGRPDAIAIELGRDMKLSDSARDDVNKEIGKNTRDAERRSIQLQELKQKDTGYNRLLLKLWEELNPEPLNRVCVYTGRPINLSMLFNGEAEVDHILPYAMTLDDSNANKLLCTREGNRQKARRAPADVMEWHDRYGEILSRANALPKNKSWRFAVNAMEKFSGERGFDARQLTDTQYVARMALTYLSSLYDAEEPDMDGLFRRHARVRALPGKMTEMLRRNWGLNELLPDHNYVEAVKKKNRLDHRHHMIDAAVIASTTRSMIQKLARASAQLGAEGSDRIARNLEQPWEGFRDDLRASLEKTVVSHKPDHGTISRQGYKQGRGQTAGVLHNDTAYGFGKDKQGKDVKVHRVALTSFAKPSDLEVIRDDKLKAALQASANGKEGKDFAAALLKFASLSSIGGAPNIYKGLRHVRIEETLDVIPIHDKNGKAYKGYKGDSNYRFDIWRMKDDKWKSEIVSMFEAHQSGFISQLRAANPTAKKILSLQQNDVVAVTEQGQRRLLRVVKFSGGSIVFAGMNEAGALKARDANKDDPFKYITKSAGSLKDIQARQVRVDEIGQVWDPGPRD